jgi:hypothetical protein
MIRDSNPSPGCGHRDARRLAWLFLLTLVILLLPVLAIAACRYEWDCSRGYPCRQVPICESPLDVPPVPPPGISPIPPPTIQPIPTPTMPPVGTQSCQPRYLCDGMGQCGWRTVCR